MSLEISRGIAGRARLLGERINPDQHCTNRYLPGKDDAYIMQHAFETVAPGFAARFILGDVIVAGRSFGAGSKLEKSVQIMRTMGVAAVVAPSFSRGFFRNAINNGLPAIECDVAQIVEGDELRIDVAAGTLEVPARGIDRAIAILPEAVRHILLAGGLIEFLKRHPDWNAVSASP